MDRKEFCINLNIDVMQYKVISMSKYSIIDSHAHYDDKAFDEDREVIFNELQENGVIQILNCASSYKSIKTTDKLTKDYKFIYGALGIHPENADELNEDVIEEIKQYIKENEKIVAIGEIGLDYYWDENPSKELQKQAFRRQMKLAEELNLPVVIHDREAHGDTLDIIKEFPNVKGVVHCFSGSVEFARECVKLGYYIGFTGVITFKNAKKTVEVAKSLPMDRILVETDCPYMSPEPNRGKRNRSDYIEYIIDKISSIKGILGSEANKIFNDNFNTLIFKEK